MDGKVLQRGLKQRHFCLCCNVLFVLVYSNVNYTSVLRNLANASIDSTLFDIAIAILENLKLTHFSYLGNVSSTSSRLK